MSNELDVVPDADEVETGVWAELRELGTFGRAWIVGVVVLCIVRAAAAWHLLVEFDINPWWFVALDVGTAPTYGLGQAMAVKILRNERRQMRESVPWILMVIVSFVAPYAYILASAGHLPSYVIVGVVLWMGLFGGLGAFRMAKEVKVDPVAT